MFYDELLIDCFHRVQWFQSHKKKATYRALDPFLRMTHTSSFSFFFCICRIECRYWPGDSLHSLDTEFKPSLQKSVQQPVCSKNHLCCLLGRLVHRWTKWETSQNQLPRWDWGSQTKVNGSVLTHSGNNAWTRDGPSKCSFWLLPKKVQKAMKLGQGSQNWSFSVKLQMIWSLSQERASCSKPCPDHTFISSLALLFQLCTTEEVQGTPEQEGRTLSNYPSSCTAKGVCAQHEARPSAQGWGPGEGSSLQAVPDTWSVPVAPGGVPWGITHGTGQTVVELFTWQLPALWWELDSSYPPVAVSCGDPCACCWPQKETSRTDWLRGVEEGCFGIYLLQM